MRKTIGTMMVALAMLACEGATGPEGPQGPQGIPGPPGPEGPAGASVAQFTGTFGASRAATHNLPAEAVAGGTLPVIQCYMSSTGQTWLAVAQTPEDTDRTFCGLVGVPANPGIQIVNGIQGWRYHLVAVW